MLRLIYPYNHSHNVNKCLRLICLCVIAIFFPLCFISCDSNDDMIGDKENDIRYYVKYVISATAPSGSAKINVMLNTEKGGTEFSVVGNSKEITWEETYGPVSDYFNTYLICNFENYNKYNSMHCKIYVSREKEPFTLKAEGSGQTIDLHYTIKF